MFGDCGVFPNRPRNVDTPISEDNPISNPGAEGIEDSSSFPQDEIDAEPEVLEAPEAEEDEMIPSPEGVDPDSPDLKYSIDYKTTLTSGPVTIKGDIPANTQMEIRELPLAEGEYFAYDINLTVDGKKYEPADDGKMVEVTVDNLNIKEEDLAKIKVVHVKDDGTEELADFYAVKPDSIMFTAKSFSTQKSTTVSSLGTPPSTGAEWSDGTYTYKYRYHWTVSSSTQEWQYIGSSPIGWGVKLTNRNATTVTASPYTYINNQPLVSMRAMFDSCSNITSINTTDFYTATVINMRGVFANLTNLSTLDLSSFDTRNVTNMYAFCHKSSGIQSITFGTNFKTSNVTDMGFMFNGCSSLTTLDVSGFNTSSNTNMNAMFWSVPASTIDVSGFNTANVTNMAGAFCGCSNVTTLNVSGFNTANVTDMSKMFSHCNSVGALDVSNFNTAKVTNMASMFNYCMSITTLNTSGFNTAKVTDMSSMFMRCYDLETLDVSGFNTSNVTDMTTMFKDCNKLSVIDTSGFNTAKVQSMTGMFTNCSSVEVLDVHSFNTSLVTNMYEMFRGCSTVETLNLSSFNTSNVTNMNGMFLGCRNVTSITLSSFNTSNVEDMSSMFSECVVLENIDISSFNTSKVLYMKEMFANCQGITSLHFGNSFKTNKVEDMSYMFSYCSALEEITFSSYFTTASCTKMQWMFHGCRSIKTLDLRNFNTTSVTDMNTMFYNDTSLKSIVVSSSFITPNSSNYRFMQNTPITAIIIDATGINTTTPDQFATAASYIPSTCKFYVYNDKETAFENAFSTTFSADRVEKILTRNGDETITIDKGSTYNDPGAIIAGFTDSESDYYSPYNFSYAISWTPSSGLNTNTAGTYTEKYTLKKGSTAQTGSTAQRTVTVTAVTNPTLMSETYSNVYPNDYIFGNSSTTIRRTNITSIEIKNNQTAPASPVATWDVSQAHDNSVKTWITQSGSQYKLTIGFSGSKLNAPVDSAYLFARYPNVTTLTGLTYLNTSNVTEMEYMFYYDSSLESIDLSGFDTSSVTRMNGMFQGCSSLTSLSLTSFNTSNVKYMSTLFSGCSLLENLDISSFNTSKVEDMGSMFSGASALVSLNLNHFDTSKVEDMSQMFLNCSSLSSLSLKGNFSTSSAKNLRAMFFECSNLETIDVSNFNTSLVTNMAGMFSGCSKLSTLNLSNFNTNNVTNMGAMFQDCTQLTSITLGTNFKTNNVIYMTSMFKSCTSLQSINLSGFNTSSVTNMLEMFSGCIALSTLNLSSFNTSNVTNMKNMFEGCSSVTSITIDPTKFVTSNVTNMYGMFSQCRRLENYDFSGFNTSNVTNMYCMLYDCGALKTLDLSSFNTASVTDMGYMFYQSGALKSIKISNTFKTPSTVTDMFGGTQMRAIIIDSTTTNGNQFATATSVITSDCKFYVYNDKLSNFRTAFSSYSSDKVQPIIGVYGDNPLNIIKGSTYMDPGPTIAGFSSGENAYYTPYTFNYTTSWSPTLNTNTTGTYTETYTLKKGATAQTGSTAQRTVKVELPANPTLMTETTANADAGYILGNTTTSVRRASVTKIVIKDDLNTPSGATIGPWDVSYNHNNSVKAWLTPSSGKYILTIGFTGDKLSLSSGSNLFGNYTSVTEITGLNLLDTSTTSTMANMFSNCQALTTFDVSTFDTSNVTDMIGMFNMCTALTSINVSNFNTSKVESMRSMFNHCESLVNLNVSGFDTSKVTSMYGMFMACFELTSINASGFNTSQVTDMSCMFNGCYKLNNLNITGFDTSKVTTMYKMFNKCYALPSVNVSGFNTSNVENMENMFNDCYVLNNIDVSGFDTSKVTTMSSMFSCCKVVTSLNVSGFDTSRVTDMFCMFNGCYALTNLDVSGFNTSNVTNMRSMFNGCNVLSTINVSGFDTSKVTTMQLMFNSCYAVTNLNVSGFDTSNVEDMRSMFNSCYAVNNLNVSGFDTSKVTTMYGMFNKCNVLSSINVSNFDTSKVTEMAGMFSHTALTSIDVSNFDTSKVTDIHGMFNGCSLLKTIDIRNFDTSSAVSGENLFKNCSALKSIVVSNKFKTPNIVTDMFLNTPITAIIIDDTAPNTTTPNQFATVTSVIPSNCKFYVYNDLESAFETAFSSYSADKVEPIIGVYGDNPLNISKGSTYKDPGPTIAGFSSGENAYYTPYGFNYTTSWSPTLNTNTPGTYTETYQLTKGGTSKSGSAATREVRVQGEAILHQQPLILSDTSTNFFGQTFTVQRGQIEGIEIKNDMTAPSGTITCSGDVSQNGDGTVWAWVTPSGSNYKLTIGFTGTILKAPVDSLYLFSYYTNATSIIGLNYLDTSNATNMINMFYGCSSLVNIDLSRFNTSNVTNMNGMFTDCQALTSLNLSNFNTSNVTNMGGMFNKCYALTSLDLSSFNTNKVTNMNYMFCECYALTSLNLSNFNTGNVTAMYCMFQLCKKLTNLDLSSFNTSNVTTMAGMFNFCDKLKSIIVSNTFKITSSPLSNMFNAPITAIIIDDTAPNGTTPDQFATASSVIPSACKFYVYNDLESAFETAFSASYSADRVEPIIGVYGTNPVQLTFGQSYVDEGATIAGFNSGENAYYTPYGFDYTSTSSASGDSTRIRYQLRKNNVVDPDSYADREVMAPPNPVLHEQSFALDTSTDFFGQTFTVRRNQIVSIEIKNNLTQPAGTITCSGDVSQTGNGSVWAWITPSGSNYKLTIGFSGTKLKTPVNSSYLFVKYTNATTISGITYLDTSSSTNMTEMFRECKALTSLDLSSFNTASVRNMNGMFYYCNSLISLDLSNFNTTLVTNMTYMFSECHALTNIDLSSFNTSSVTSMKQMFLNCQAVTSLDVSNFNTASVRDMSGMFYYCNSLISLDLSNFNTANVTDMKDMFFFCESLTSLDVSSFNTAKVTNMNAMFRDCKSLTSLNVSSFNTAKVTNMTWMFGNCRALTSINLSNFNTERVTEMRYMFYDCRALTSLDLSNFNTVRVTRMDNMFSYCAALTSIDLSSFNTANVTVMYAMFRDCKSLTSLDLSSFNTAKVTLIDDMFAGCQVLKSIVVANTFKTPSTVPEMFSGTPITAIIIDDTAPNGTTPDQFATATSVIPSTCKFYVYNDLESAFETAFSSYSADKVEPIIGVYGDNPTTVQQGGTYVDQGATVAGFAPSESAYYTPYQYSYTTDSSQVNTNTAGTYTVRYQLQKGNSDVTGSYAERTVKVANNNYQNMRTNAKYETLKDAIDASNSGDTIQVLATNVTDSSAATIPNTKTITLDVPSGKTITRTGSTALTVGGKLILKGAGTIKSTATSTIVVQSGGILDITTDATKVENTAISDTYIRYAIDNSGEVTSSKGIISSTERGIHNTGKYTMSGGSVTVSGTSSDVGVSNQKDFIMTGGSITATNVGIYLHTDSSATLTMSGGTVLASSNKHTYGIQLEAGKVTISGSSVISGDTSSNIEAAAGVVVGSGEATISGTPTISGKTFAIWNTGTSSKKATISIAGGTYSSAGTAVVELHGNNSADDKVTITGGTFTGGTYGIFNAGNGEVILGTNGGTPSTTVPYIQSATGYKGDTTTGKLYFYDGVFKGSTSAITGSNTITPQTNYSVIYGIENISGTDYETATLGLTSSAPYQLQSNSRYYSTLQAAIRASANTDTITVIATNVTDSSTATIPSGKTITLDVPSGKKITKTTSTITNGGTLHIKGTGTITSSDNIHTITNNGTLNITTDATTISNTRAIGSQKDAIYNNGTLKISKGTVTGSFHAIENTGNVEISGTARLTNTNTSNSVVYTVASSGTVTMTGGTVESNSYGIHFNNGSTLNLSGGTVTSAIAIYAETGSGKAYITGGTVIGSNIGIYNKTTATVTIGTQGGGAPSTTSPVIRGATAYKGDSTSGKLNFYDGVFQGSTLVFNNQNTVTPETGYSIVYGSENISGTDYETAYLAATASIPYQVLSTERYYTTLENAIAGCATTDTIKVIADNITDSSTAVIPSTKTITLDVPNGKTITKAGTGIVNNGTLSIKGTGTITSSGNMITLDNYGTLQITTDMINMSNTAVTDNWCPAIYNRGTAAITKGNITGCVHAVINEDTLEIGGTAHLSNSCNTGNSIVYAEGGAITTMTGGTIERSDVKVIGVNLHDSTFYMSGGTINANCAILCDENAGRAYITGGSVIGTTYGIQNKAGGIITIGEQGGTPSITSPVIRGNTAYRGEDAAGKLFFYDGVFQGKTQVFNNRNTVTTEDGYDILYGTTSISGTTYQTAKLGRQITGSVSIVGTVKMGQTLRAQLNDVIPTGCTYAYQWYYTSTSGDMTNGTAISGATSNTLALNKEVYIGKYIYVIVNATKTDCVPAEFSDITSITAQRDDLDVTLVMTDYIYGGALPTPRVTGNLGNGEVTYMVYQGTNQAGAVNWETIEDGVSLAPGQYKMYATIAQTVCYNAATTNTVIFNVTRANLTVTLTANDESYSGAWTNKDVVASAEEPDGLVMMAGLKYRLDGETNYRTMDNATAFGTTFRMTFTENLNKKVYFVAVDGDGTVLSNETAGKDIKIDKDKPTIGAISYSPTEYSNTKTVTVSGISDVGGSGVTGYYFTSGDYVPTESTTFTSLTGNSFTYTIADNGTYKAYVRDAAGNISDVTTLEITTIAYKVSDIRLEQNIVMNVYEEKTPRLVYSGDPISIEFFVDDTNVATVDHSTGLITGLASGETTYRVRFTDYDGEVTDVTSHLTVKALTPTFKISNPNGFRFTYGDDPRELTIAYNGDGVVSMGTYDTSIVTIEMEGNVLTATPKKAGTTSFRLTATETPHYLGGVIDVNVVVSPRPIDLTWSGGPFQYDGTPKQVTATLNNRVGTDTVNFTYKDNRKTDAGNYIAEVTAVSNPNYTVEDGVNITYAWKITKTPRTLNLPEEITTHYGTNAEVRFTYSGDDTTALIEFDKPAVARTEYTDGTNGGVVTIIPAGVGSGELIVTIPETNNNDAIEGRCIINVLPITPTLTLSETNITMEYGDSTRSVEFTYDGNSTVRVATPEDRTVVSTEVDRNYILITPKKTGTTTVNLTIAATPQYEEVSASLTVTVTPRRANIVWGTDTFDYDGTEKQMTASISNLVQGDNVQLTISGDRYVNAGEYVAEITGISNNSYTLEGVTNLTHNWRINKARRAVDAPNTYSLVCFEEKVINYSYVGHDVDATVTVDNETVLGVEHIDTANGGTLTLTGLKIGTTQIRITLPEEDNYSETTFIMNVAVQGADPRLGIEANTASFIYGDAPKKIGYSTESGGTVIATSASTSIATASVEDGKIVITPVKAGSTIVTVRVAATAQYSGDSKTISVTIAKRPVELRWSAKSFKYDGMQKTVTATVNNVVGSDSVTVSGYNGNAQTNIGSYTATATALSNSNYTLTGGTNITHAWVIRELVYANIVVKQAGTVIPEGEWAKGDVTVEISADGLSSYTPIIEYSFNNTDWTEYSNPFTIDEETTSKMIYARVRDRETAEDLTLLTEREVKMDKTKPQIRVTNITSNSPVEGAISKNSTITITYEIEDNTSGMNHTEFTIDDLSLLANYKGMTKIVTTAGKTLVSDPANSTKQNGKYLYTLTITGIEDNGDLSLRMIDNAIKDRAGNGNLQITTMLGLRADNEGPDVSLIDVDVDEYGRVNQDDVELSVEATDDSGIASYEWQVSEDERNWGTFETDTSGGESSEAVYHANEDGEEIFRVVVKDLLGNESISEVRKIKIVRSIIRKPTIRFEFEEVTPTTVTIKAIVKSTTEITKIQVDSRDIPSSMWNTEKVNNEYTVTTTHQVTANGTYRWTVRDDKGNEIYSNCNVASIDESSPIVTYHLSNVTEFSKARIEFESNQDVRIAQVSIPGGTVTNVATPTSISGMTFDHLDYSKRINATLTDEFVPGTRFIFSNKVGLTAEVEVTEEITTKVVFVRFLSNASLGSTFDLLFGSGFGMNHASALVGRLTSQMKNVSGRYVPYYGLSSRSTKVEVADAQHINAVNELANLTKSGNVLSVGPYGDAIALKASQTTASNDSSYSNGNVTGVRNTTSSIIGTVGSTKTSFRLVVHVK